MRLGLLAGGLLIAALATSSCSGGGAGGGSLLSFGSKHVTVPAGTRLNVVLDTSVGSDTSRVEDPVQGHLAEPLIVEGQMLADVGSEVSGVVTDATLAGKVEGLSHVAVRFNALTPSGGDENYTIDTGSVGRTGEATKEKDALEIAAPAAGGAIIGALLGGKKGALIGTAAGGGAGTAVVLSTRGKEVRLARGAMLTLQLAAPVRVRVKT